MQESSKQFKAALLFNRRPYDFDFAGDGSHVFDQHVYTESSDEITDESNANEEDDFYAMMMRQISKNSEIENDDNCDCQSAKTEIKKEGRKRLKLVQPMRDSLDQFFNLDHRLRSRGEFTQFMFSGSILTNFLRIISVCSFSETRLNFLGLFPKDFGTYFIFYSQASPNA